MRFKKALFKRGKLQLSLRAFLQRAALDKFLYRLALLSLLPGYKQLGLLELS
jgi:hypothetical protein